MLDPGVRLGPYKIVRQLGAGGMGEVYEATDGRLDRVVAVKILPSAYADDARLRLRFEREAKAISALNHPHICSVHDVGEDTVGDECVRYFVMEYCEGESLKQRLARGPLPLKAAIDYGTQIADALAKAHRAGIIHRDVKPGNIMITKSGVKLLDFGLAKRRCAAPSPADDATMDLDLTRDGRITGTARYLAPEILAGAEPDARSDIWALGLVLYEMIEGKDAHVGSSGSPIYAVAAEEEPLSFSRGIPAQVRHVVTSCLRPDPDDRLQSAADLAEALRFMATRRGRAEASWHARGWKLATAVALLAACALAAALVLTNARAPRRAAVARRLTTIQIPVEASLVRGGGVAISPDGRWLVFASSNAGPLYAKRFAESGAYALPGTDGASSPFFSPDSQWIGFSVRGTLKKLPVGGGVVQTICSAGCSGPAAWGAEDVIVFVSPERSLSRIGSSGGAITRVTSPTSGESHTFPSFLPDGRTLLFQVRPYPNIDPNLSKIVALDLKTGDRSTLIDGGCQPRYSPTGHLLFLRTSTADLRSGTLFSVAFDPRRVRIRGESKPRATDLQSYSNAGFAFWDVAPDGAIVYVPYLRALNEREIAWFDSSGHASRAGGGVAIYSTANLSPDGTRVAVSDYKSVLVGDLARDVWVKIETGGIYNLDPIWSPDGTRVAFSSLGDRGWGVYTANADGTGTPALLHLHSEATAYASSWSPDGRVILYYGQAPPNSEFNIFQIDVATGRTSAVISTPYRATSATFSPDGRWIAWETQDPTSRVYVAPYPELTPHHVIGAGAPCPVQGPLCVAGPRWARDGRAIIYKSGDRIMAVDIDTRSGFSSGKPRFLFQSDFDVDVSPDANRFIAPRYLVRPSWNHLNVLNGWWDAQ